MSRRGGDDEPFLFDLPLVREDEEDDAAEEPAPPAPGAPARATAAPLAPADDPAGWDVVGMEIDEPAAAEVEIDAPPAAAAVAPAPAGLAPRLLAAVVDGAALAAVAALAVVGAVLLGLRPGTASLPGLAALLVVFSFAWSVVPLAFWGATPGMAAARLVARDRDGGPLTFGQTALRWTAGLLTLLTAGLPMLLALGFLGGRSPADRLSGSLTWRRR